MGLTTARCLRRNPRLRDRIQQVVGTGGGSAIEQGTNDLRDAIHEYFGQLNEVKLGIHRKIPIKPDALDNWDYYNKFKLPFVNGGILDQPYLLMNEMEVASEELANIKLMQDAANGVVPPNV